MGWFNVWGWRRWIDEQRKVADYRRGEQRPLLFADLDQEHTDTRVPSVPSFEDETVKRLDAQARLRTLSPRHRQALMLTAAGYTTEEIGLSLGVSAARVSEMKQQARKRMAKA